MRRVLGLLALAGALLLLQAPRAAAQCDVPLILGGGSSANVLLIIDTSGSMNEIVFHSAYNPNTRYSGDFDRDRMYSVSSDGSRTPRNFDRDWPDTPSAYLVNSDGGRDGDYSGNYLNWVYFNATASQRAAIPTYTKIQGAKSVVNQILGDITTVRFAVECFNGSDGGTIVAPFGTSVAAMQTLVDGLQGDSWTPLAESMEDALDYYKQTGLNAPIQAACEKSFVILITDGMPTQDVGVSSYLKSASNDCAGNDPGSCTSLGTAYSNSYDCSAYLDNVTCYMYRNDLRADLEGIQNVGVFTVGFAIDTPFLQAAADAGGGEYYTANDVDGLVTSLTQAMNTIARRVAAGTSVAVVSTEDRTNSKLFRARYESGTWRGYVESFDLPFHSGVAASWEAGALLAARSPGSRTILTSSTGTNMVDFSTGNAASLMSLLGAADVSEATDIINYVSGAAVTGTRDRGGWVLGDVVDAAPVAVGKPTGYNSLPGYAAFRNSHVGRAEMVYVCANDGMLHAFDASNGTELWAYVPRTQLPRVKDLMDPAYCHAYFVNTTPAVYDIKIGSNWKTVLFAGEEAGRNGMFAFDVTDPRTGHASVLWDVDVPRLQGSSNTPTLVRDKASNSYRLCVGTGFSSSAWADSLVVLDPASGSVIDRIGLGSSVAGNKTTRATAVDLDSDGYDDVLYLGDLAGSLWRVNLKTSPWTKTQLFRGTQPIQAPPVVTVDAMERPMVFFGTGQFVSGSDPRSTTTQAIFGIIDDGTGATLTAADLVNQTSTFTTVASNGRGWYLDLVKGAGERVTRGAALVNGTLYVASFSPGSSSCAGGGQSWLYSLDFEDGSAPDHANGSENNTIAGRAQSMGDGMLADPTVDIVNEAILLQSSNAVVMTQNIAGGLKKLIVRGWHQKWN